MPCTGWTKKKGCAGRVDFRSQRREFITLIPGASLAGQRVAHAQQAGIPVIGYLSGRSQARLAED
jgi:hypothetical protein